MSVLQTSSVCPLSTWNSISFKDVYFFITGKAAVFNTVYGVFWVCCCPWAFLVLGREAHTSSTRICDVLPFPTGWWDFKSQISWLHNLSYDWPGVPAGWTCSADGYKFFFNLQKGMIVLVQHLELIYYTGIFLALNVKCCNGRYQKHSWAFKGREVHSYPSRPALDVVLVWKRNAFAFE